MSWLRRLFGAPPPRGTLTLFDGTAIVGFPPGHEPAPEEAQMLQARLQDWIADDFKPLVLPFPVDVTDYRERK